MDFVITGGGLCAGATVTTNAAGVARLDGLAFGDYVATEQVPTGYVSDDAVKEDTVNANSNCGGGNEATVSFHNTPLTDFTVSVNSQVDSGTASTTTCGSSSASTDPNGDGSLALSDLQPSTVTCTIVIDREVGTSSQDTYTGISQGRGGRGAFPSLHMTLRGGEPPPSTSVGAVR